MNRYISIPNYENRIIYMTPLYQASMTHRLEDFLIADPLQERPVFWGAQSSYSGEERPLCHITITIFKGNVFNKPECLRVSSPRTLCARSKCDSARTDDIHHCTKHRDGMGGTAVPIRHRIVLCISYQK